MSDAKTDSRIREKYLPFTSPDMGEAEIAEVADSMRSGWLTTGPKTQRFIKDFNDYIGAKFGVAVNSATSGLHIAYLAGGLRQGDELLTSAMTFVATSNTAIHCGATPKFADIDIATLNVTAATLEAAMTPKTKIIVPVHYAGLPCDMDPILELARRRNCLVVEDAAHSVGAEYKGRKIGLFGDMTVFSFHPNKNMTTGEGGFISFGDEKYKEPLELLSFHGMNKNAWNRFSSSGNPNYDVELPGFKYNMLDMQAAVGIHQLRRLDAFNARRAEIVKRYYEAFGGMEELRLTKAPSYQHKHVWHLFTPLVLTEKLSISRDEFMSLLKAENIGTGYHYRAVHLHPCYEKLGFRRGMFPNAEYVSDRIVSLPLFPKMTDGDVEDVIKGVRKVLAGALKGRR